MDMESGDGKMLNSNNTKSSVATNFVSFSLKSLVVTIDAMSC
jgi:hypothetical protein